MVISKSKSFTEEYCCSVVKVGTLEPVENSDNLVKTLINGESIVVNKNDVHEGDVMLYISNECQISSWFLSANNLYQNYELNKNREIVQRELKKDPDFLKSDKIKTMRGYFTDNGRVRMIKLRGCPSFGVLFNPVALEIALKTLYDKESTVDWSTMVGTDFDMVEDFLLVRAYVPPVKVNNHHTGTGAKKVSKWDRFDRMIPGQFKLHYDTGLLKKHLSLFDNPFTDISVTVKLHGTSFICGNLLVNYPKKFFRLRRWMNTYLRTDIKEFDQKYGMVCSSRKVIKNEWANNANPEGYYGQDIWTEYANIIYPYLPQGTTIYGEICGYLTNSSKMIQKNYDYGCRTGENFLMIYRVTTHTEEGIKEYSMDQVINFTNWLISQMKSLEDVNVKRIFNIGNVKVYDGKIGMMSKMAGRDTEYLPTALAAMANIEDNEPLCNNKVPREGVVVRINNDQIPEAFKLKSLKFLEKEKVNIDNGEVDIEMQNNEQ